MAWKWAELFRILTLITFLFTTFYIKKEKEASLFVMDCIPQAVECGKSGKAREREIKFCFLCLISHQPLSVIWCQSDSCRRTVMVLFNP